MGWIIILLAILAGYFLSLCFVKLLMTESKGKTGFVLADERFYGIWAIVCFAATLICAIIFFAKGFLTGMLFITVWLFNSICTAIKKKSKEQKIKELQEVMFYKKLRQSEEDCQHLLVYTKKSKKDEPTKYICPLCGRRILK